MPLQLVDVGNLALGEGLDPEASMAAMAIAQTEGGLTGAAGDNGQSHGPYQFYSGGQLKNFAADLHVSLAEAATIARDQPDLAVKWALSPRGSYGWKSNGYLGDTLRAAQQQGLHGADLATYAQHYGQVSVSPERAGQNYAALWGDYQPPTAPGAGASSSSFTPQPSDLSYPDWSSPPPGPQSSGAASSGYVFPVVGYQGPINLHQGSVRGGSDLMFAGGTPVVAMRGGRVKSVTTAADGGPGGNSVLVAGDDGNDYYYAHLRDTPLAQAGDQLPAGGLFGYVGDTGNAKGTGTHLHIGIGPSILGGVGPTGGTGGDYNAVGLLNSVYANEYGSPSAAPTNPSGGATSWTQP